MQCQIIIYIALKLSLKDKERNKLSPPVLERKSLLGQCQFFCGMISPLIVKSFSSVKTSHESSILNVGAHVRENFIFMLSFSV